MLFALPGIIFNRGEAGLGRPLPGNDHISGMVLYFLNANLPSGYAIDDRSKKYFSIDEAIADGITEAGANTKILFYHIKEYFRIQPKGVLYVHLADDTGISYDEHQVLQRFADGEIRQFLIYDLSAYLPATLTTIQAATTVLESEFQPCQVLYAADMQALTLGGLASLNTLSNKNVHLIISEDGAGDGAALAISESTSITDGGAKLGAVSLAKVNQNIGWKQNFNMTDGQELEVPAFATGATTELFKDQASSLITTLHDDGFLFLLKDTGFDGTYNNGFRSAIIPSNDLSTGEKNRTLDKGARNIRTILLPQVNGELFFNADGTLTEDTIAFFKNEAGRPLVQMQRDGEISAFIIEIDPTQNAQSTGKLKLTAKLVPVGVAEQIEVNIGFTLTT